MNSTSFYTRLAYVTLPLVALFLILQSFVPVFLPYAPFSWASVAFFVVFSWIVFIFGTKASKSDNKNDFTRFSMMVIMGKLFLSVFLVIGYVVVAEPANRFVVLPFIPIYVVYTVFETDFMMKLAQVKK
ncbi:MAG: hypothetical protein ACI85O_002388 [Saprospiraceae bacterium]|jgi:hypothetical protein